MGLADSGKEIVKFSFVVVEFLWRDTLLKRKRVTPFTFFVSKISSRYDTKPLLMMPDPIEGQYRVKVIYEIPYRSVHQQRIFCSCVAIRISLPITFTSVNVRLGLDLKRPKLVYAY